jgi:hypothetical protein
MAALVNSISCGWYVFAMETTLGPCRTEKSCCVLLRGKNLIYPNVEQIGTSVRRPISYR